MNQAARVRLVKDTDKICWNAHLDILGHSIGVLCHHISMRRATAYDRLEHPPSYVS
jgi:hypothetical protein